MADNVFSKEIARPVAGFFLKAWYWVWGGIHAAAKRALSLRYADSVEFNNSAALMALGVWLLMPGVTLHSPSATAVLTALFPDWVWSIAFIGIGRYGIHCMLKCDVPSREWATSLTLTGWLFLLLVSFAVRPTALETALLAYMVWRSAVLYWQLGKAE